MKLKQSSNGHPAVKLESVITEATSGFACGQRADDGVIQLRMNNVTRRGELDWSSVLRVPSEMTDLESFALRSGDVLFNNTNSTELVGKTVYFDTFKEPVVFSNHFTRLRADTTKLDPGYLALWLHKKFLDGLFAKICDRWIGQSAVQRSKLLGLEISLPPVTEQRQMAARLREQMAAVEQARTAVQAQLETAQALPAALLRATFNSPTAKKWPRKRVEELIASPLRTGLSKSGKADSPWRCLNLSSVRNGKLIMDAAKPVDVTAREAEANQLRPGAFYIVRGNGNPKLVARGALAPNILTDAILYPDLLIEMNPDHGKILPLYLRWVWDSAEVRTALEERARTSAGIYKINLTNLAGIEIPLPSIADQQIIAVRLDTEMTAALTLFATLETRLAEIELLTAALLRDAFSQQN